MKLHISVTEPMYLLGTFCPTGCICIHTDDLTDLRTIDLVVFLDRIPDQGNVSVCFIYVSPQDGVTEEIIPYVTFIAAATSVNALEEVSISYGTPKGHSVSGTYNIPVCFADFGVFLSVLSHPNFQEKLQLCSCCFIDNGLHTKPT